MAFFISFDELKSKIMIGANQQMFRPSDDKENRN